MVVFRATTEGGFFDPTVTNPMFKLKAWIYAWIYAWTYAWTYAWIHAWIYAWIHAWIYAWTVSYTHLTLPTKA